MCRLVCNHIFKNASRRKQASDARSYGNGVGALLKRGVAPRDSFFHSVGGGGSLKDVSIQSGAGGVPLISFNEVKPISRISACMLHHCDEPSMRISEIVNPSVTVLGLLALSGLAIRQPRWKATSCKTLTTEWRFESIGTDAQFVEKHLIKFDSWIVTL